MRARLPAGRETQAGFTLLEVIVALAVLGFLMAGLAQATRFGMTAWGLETKMSDKAASLERVDRVLRQLIEQASPQAAADDKPFEGKEHTMLFHALLPDEPEAHPVRRAEIALGVDDHHQLVLRWREQPNAMLMAARPPPQHQIVLAEGLDRIDLAYRQAASDGGKWSKSWSDGSIPAAVQIHFVLSNGHHRWPDMVVPTMLDPNGSF